MERLTNKNFSQSWQMTLDFWCKGLFIYYLKNFQLSNCILLHVLLLSRTQDLLYQNQRRFFCNIGSIDTFDTRTKHWSLRERERENRNTRSTEWLIERGGVRKKTGPRDRDITKLQTKIQCLICRQTSWAYNSSIVFGMAFVHAHVLA